MKEIIYYRPPRIAIILLGLSIVLWKLSPNGTILCFPYKFLGSLCLVSGFTITMWAWLQFKKVKTAVCPTEDTTVLITEGIYRYTRNPMYLGFFLMLTGAAFLMGSVSTFLSPILFWLIMDRYFIPFEELKLTNSYADHYVGYYNKTRRWI